MTQLELEYNLRRLELGAYSNVVSAFIVQGDMTEETKNILHILQLRLSISTEHHMNVVRRAVCDEKLMTIAYNLSAPFYSNQEWLKEGGFIPLSVMSQQVPQTANMATADTVMADKAPVPVPVVSSAAMPLLTRPSNFVSDAAVLPNGNKRQLEEQSGPSPKSLKYDIVQASHTNLPKLDALLNYRETAPPCSSTTRKSICNYFGRCSVEAVEQEDHTPPHITLFEVPRNRVNSALSKTQLDNAGLYYTEERVLPFSKSTGALAVLKSNKVASASNPTQACSPQVKEKLKISLQQKKRQKHVSQNHIDPSGPYTGMKPPGANTVPPEAGDSNVRPWDVD